MQPPLEPPEEEVVTELADKEPEVRPDGRAPRQPRRIPVDSHIERKFSLKVNPEIVNVLKIPFKLIAHHIERLSICNL